MKEYIKQYSKISIPSNLAVYLIWSFIEWDMYAPIERFVDLGSRSPEYRGIMLLILLMEMVYFALASYNIVREREDKLKK